MKLYRYRTVENAIKEIENGTFYFPTLEELNDPIEGFVSIYWKGDKIAWEGMLSNYICSVNNVFELYLIGTDEKSYESYCRKKLILDLTKCKDIPLEKLNKEITKELLEDEEVKKIIELYGDNEIKVKEKELRMILFYIHMKALMICFVKAMKYGVIPDINTELLIKKYIESKNIGMPFAELRMQAKSGIVFETANNFMEDITDAKAVELISMKDKNYGDITSDNEPRVNKNWAILVGDIPFLYVEQLKRLLYPEFSVICFSEANDNSSMWGNYADNHRGVCLEYDTGDGNSISIENISKNLKKVIYGGDTFELNFFESLGRLNMQQVRSWLSGENGISKLISCYENKEAWQDRYWKTFEKKSCYKIKDWEGEKEYRIIRTDIFSEFDDKEKRICKYETKVLKGVIFGIRTSVEDKARILRALKNNRAYSEGIAFYQEEYDEFKQRIKVRKKDAAIWNLGLVDSVEL